MISNIQFLRFLAAYSVAAFHFANPYARWGDGWFGLFVLPFKTYGFVGVDVFFVISGFIIWRSTEERHGRADVLPFLCRRFARIFIGYWPWLAVMLWVFFLVRGKPASTVDWLSTILLWPGSSVLPVAWTLTFELMFYIVFGLLMVLPRRLAFLALVVWGAVALVASSSTTGAMFLMPFVAEFCAGCMLAAALKRFQPSVWLAVLLGAIAFGAGVLLNVQETLLLRVLTFGSFGVAAVATAVCVEERYWKAGPFWVLLGNASYALYLAHFPILSWGRTYWKVVKENPDLLFGGLLIASLFVSVAWYVFVERPLQQASSNFFDRMFGRRFARTPTSAATLPAS